MHHDIRFSYRRQYIRKSPDMSNPLVVRMEKYKEQGRECLLHGHNTKALKAFRSYFRLYNRIYDEIYHMDLNTIRMYAQALQRTGNMKLAVTQYLLTYHDFPRGILDYDLDAAIALFREGMRCVGKARREDLVDVFAQKVNALKNRKEQNMKEEIRKVQEQRERLEEEKKELKRQEIAEASRSSAAKKFWDLSKCMGKFITGATVLHREHRDPDYQIYLEFSDGTCMEFYAEDKISVSGTMQGPASRQYSEVDEGLEVLYRVENKN